MGTAFVKAGDRASHERLCRLVLAAQPDPPEAGDTERFAKLCFLAGDRLPEDLKASGLEMSRLVTAMTPDRLRREGANPAWSWLAGGMAEYYAGDVNRALELLRQAADSDTVRCRETARVYLAMTLQKLGREAEAAQVLEEAGALIDELSGSRDAEGWWDVDIAGLALEEARQLIGRPSNP
jgi:tetratricopeptide (TPR) repeat protein